MKNEVIVYLKKYFNLPEKFSVIYIPFDSPPTYRVQTEFDGRYIYTEDVELIRLARDRSIIGKYGYSRKANILIMAVN